MASAAKKEAKIWVKAIVDKVKEKVVYVEADHTFVDILFSFITLPIGTVIRLLKNNEADHELMQPLRSLKNLYQSLVDFPECFLATEECKHLLLNPRSISYDHCTKLKIKLDDTEPLNYFTCASCAISSFFFVSTCSKAKCWKCGNLMSREVGYNKADVSSGGDGVFVSDIANFIVTDELCVMPYTSANSIHLLSKHGISDKSSLENIKLHMDCEQMLNLLRVALSFGSVFSYIVFHRKNLFLLPSYRLGQTDLMKKEQVLTSKIHLEVYMQTSTRKVLFAEAKEDFVDFLFGFLSIPLGTVIGKLLSEASFSGCIVNVFKSISKMSVGRYIKSQDIKDMLLKPHIGQQFSSKHQMFSLKGTPSHYEFLELKSSMIIGGLLKQSGMFIVTEELIITPASSCSTLDTLNDFKVSFKDVEKHEISIGLTEGLKILKASLSSRSILTDSLEHLLKKK
ncbi:hypothetical protein QVD17_27655 [Tagetes erecta]|uniref:Uncharacterized protein n=1 Tax=Tagetes erecta TaxID=13708 RepID=A0AAD8KF90_TARER|nr:hypothetical protein QVD17_27655 [Tagetes erecta]